MGFAPDRLSHDKFLNGRLTILQPVSGYRAGVDPVLLAACVNASHGQSVLELGCGAGVASLCLGHRVPGLVLHGVELQADYADLARRNAADNNIEMQVETADLLHLPSALRGLSFDHVIANPPYYKRQRGTGAVDKGRDMARAGATTLTDWIDVAARRLAPGGNLTMIQRSDRLGDVLQGIDGRMGDILVQPIAPRVGRKAELIIMRARKGARGDLVLAAPIIMHKGATHDGDRESYTDQILAVLRGGAPLSIGS